MKIEILPSAREDLVEGFAFYEKQRAGLGSYFLDSLFRDIGSLAVHAGIHRRVFGTYRMLAQKFPFAIYYDLHGKTARVKAVLDCRRDPAWVRRNLGP